MHSGLLLLEVCEDFEEPDESVWRCVLQADGQSGSHAKPACGGERVEVLEPGRLAPGNSAGIPDLGGRQCAAASRWVSGLTSNQNTGCD